MHDSVPYMYHILSEGEERMMVKQWQGVGGELVAELGKKEGHCSDVFQKGTAQMCFKKAFGWPYSPVLFLYDCCNFRS